MSLRNLIRVNSSVFVTPAAGFVVVIILTKQSRLPEDAFYFFVLGIVGFVSLVDGGIPFRRLGPMTERRFIRVMRCLVANWSWSIFPMSCVVTVLCVFTQFARTQPVMSTTLLVGLSIASASCKLFADSARVLGLQSQFRPRINSLSSAMALFRVLAAWSLVNRVPFLYVHAVLSVIELYAYLANLRGPSLRGLRLYVPTFRWRVRIYRDYVVANIGYLLGASADRILAFYFVGTEAYRGIVLQLAFFNMALLPHKMVENDMMFDTSGKDTKRHMSILMCAIGAIAIGASMGLQGADGVHSAPQPWLLVGVAALWIAITVIYNRQWAASLRQGSTTHLANGTRVAGVAAVLAGLLLHDLYGQWVLVATMFYAVINVLVASRDPHGSSQVSAYNFAVYLAFSAIHACGGYFATAWLYAMWHRS